MSNNRKLTNGLLVVVVVAIVSGMIAWGIIAHYQHKNLGHHGEHAMAEEKLVQKEEISDNERNNGVVKGCHGPPWKCSLRLDASVIPRHYEIFLNPNIQTGTFTGRVKINVSITDDVEHIRLHMKDMDILRTTVTGVDGANLNITAFQYADNEFWVIDHLTSNEMFRKGNYTIEMEFQGDMTKKIVGIYRASYFDRETNETKYVVSTKFQPTYARRAFPCFDEPGFKSTFALRVVRPRNLTCISNMPIYSEEINTPEPGYTTVFFQKSVPMVTYLVAFALGEFESRDGATKRGLPVKVYATKPLAKHVEYAASIAPKMLDYFEDYFQTTYPLPKLDIIGIPEFISGAMEHWGMISFRESNLVYTPGVSSAYNKKRVAAVISHEIAHMWFGNLVTLKWWNDLWLNEGFASYMEYKGVDHVHPEWKINWQFLADDFADTLRLDGRKSSHPIVQAVSHPNQITELFDTISYSKGATVIRMLEDFMGPQRFRRGVTAFLQKYKFKNAVTQDLWDCLQAEVNGSVKIDWVMSTWTKQMGYPVLTPTQLDMSTIRVSQERFHEIPANPEKSLARSSHKAEEELNKGSSSSPYNYAWEIPIRVEYGVGKEVKSKLFWMHYNMNEMDLHFDEEIDWFKLNPGYVGLYRVNYRPSTIRRIKMSRLEQWTVPDKCGLARDLFALATGNYTGFSEALEFGRVLEGETEFLLWDCVDGHLRKIGKLLRKGSENGYGVYKKYMQSLLNTTFTAVRWNDTEGEDLMKRMIKPKILSLACEYEVEGCRQKAHDLLLVLLDTPEIVPGGLRDIVYKWGMYKANSETWEILWNKYTQEDDPQERVRMLRSLASTQEPELIKRLLKVSQDDKVVRKQDYFGVLKYISQNPNGAPIIWKFYKDNYENLTERYGSDNKYFGRVILDVTSDFTTEEQLEEVVNLVTKYPNGGAGTNSRKYALENVRNNIEWRNLHASKVEDWLLKNY